MKAEYVLVGKAVSDKWFYKLWVKLTFWFSLLSPQNSEEVCKVVNVYCSFAEYEANLEDKITGETSGYFQRLLVVLLQVSISLCSDICVWFSLLFSCLMYACCFLLTKLGFWKDLVIGRIASETEPLPLISGVSLELCYGSFPHHWIDKLLWCLCLLRGVLKAIEEENIYFKKTHESRRGKIR